MPTDPVRAKFEARASDNGKWPRAIERSGDGYKLMQTHSDWMAYRDGWNAALAAQEGTGNYDGVKHER